MCTTIFDEIGTDLGSYYLDGVLNGSPLASTGTLGLTYSGDYNCPASTAGLFVLCLRLLDSLLTVSLFLRSLKTAQILPIAPGGVARFAVPAALLACLLAACLAELLRHVTTAHPVPLSTVVACWYTEGIRLWN